MSLTQRGHGASLPDFGCLVQQTSREVKLSIVQACTVFLTLVSGRRATKIVPLPSEGPLHVGPEVFHGVRHPALVFSSYLVCGLLFSLVCLFFWFRSFALALVVASFRRLLFSASFGYGPLGCACFSQLRSFLRGLVFGTMLPLFCSTFSFLWSSSSSGWTF